MLQIQHGREAFVLSPQQYRQFGWNGRFVAVNRAVPGQRPPSAARFRSLNGGHTIDARIPRNCGLGPGVARWRPCLRPVSGTPPSRGTRTTP
jgi:hypothetical protein